MWRLETPAISPMRLIEELSARAAHLRETATAASGEERAETAMRQWADELDRQARMLAITSWGVR